MWSEDAEQGHPLGVAETSSQLAAPLLQPWTRWAEKTNIRDGLGLPLCKETSLSLPAEAQGEGPGGSGVGEEHQGLGVVVQPAPGGWAVGGWAAD